MDLYSALVQFRHGRQDICNTSSIPCDVLKSRDARFQNNQLQKGYMALYFLASLFPYVSTHVLKQAMDSVRCQYLMIPQLLRYLLELMCYLFYSLAHLN